MISLNSFCLFLEDSTVKGKPSERNREKKATRPVRKVQKLTRLSSPESKQGDYLCCRGKTVACPSDMSFVSRNKEKLKHIAFEVLLDVQQCCCCVFVDHMLHWVCMCLWWWVVGWVCFFLFLLMFCLSTCCVHLTETAEDCFLGLILRGLTGQNRQKVAIGLLWILLLLCLC